MSPVSNERTSVALSLRRYFLLSARMRASETMAMAKSPRARAGAMRASQAARPAARTGRPWPSVTCTLISGLSGSTERFVRLHNLLDKVMADHVLVVEVHERDALDMADDLHRLYEPGGAADRQIDLRDVAGDHRLRAEAQAGQEHLHLLRGRVLRFVEDHERVGEAAAAH